MQAPVSEVLMEFEKRRRLGVSDSVQQDSKIAPPPLVRVFFYQWLVSYVSLEGLSHGDVGTGTQGEGRSV